MRPDSVRLRVCLNRVPSKYTQFFLVKESASCITLHNLPTTITTPSTNNMAENQPPPSTNPADTAGIPYYNKEREKLQDLLRRKKLLELSIARQDEAIYKKETDYFEDTPAGNIITGFDNYTKGLAGSIGGRRRTGVPEQNRVFSRSSVTYNINAETPVDTAQSTPVAAMAPTPLSTSFLKDGGASNHATPTSATSKSGGAGKKNIKKARDGDDSETDGKEGNKKIRTNFGAVRK